MTDNVAVVICFAIVATVPISTLIHNNERDYQMQRACMAAGGNWETRENSNEIGCRFPSEPPGVGR